MKHRYFRSILIWFAYCIMACNRSNKTPQQLLLGVWTLKLQKLVVSVNGVQQSTNTVTSSAYNYGTLEFKSNGSFISINHSSSGPGTFTLSETVNGTYTYNGTIFKVTAPFANLLITLQSGMPVSPPVITLISHSEKITTLTTNLLIIHAEQVVKYQTPSVTKTYDDVDDYIYNKP